MQSGVRSAQRVERNNGVRVVQWSVKSRVWRVERKAMCKVEGRVEQRVWNGEWSWSGVACEVENGEWTVDSRVWRVRRKLE